MSSFLDADRRDEEGAWLERDPLGWVHRDILNLVTIIYRDRLDMMHQVA